jgi:hypothetical protein
MIGAAEKGLCYRIAFTEGCRTSGWKELGTVNVTTVSEQTALYRGRPADHYVVTDRKVRRERMIACCDMQHTSARPLSDLHGQF